MLPIEHSPPPIRGTTRWGGPVLLTVRGLDRRTVASELMHRRFSN